jgi:C4-dicarboxylate-specific signal transduction histidine kinase
MADRVKLQQVLMNLMINGIEATRDSNKTRELTITSRQAEADQVLVPVTDSGVGLPTQQIEQIFDAFFTTKPNRTGMGLRISRSIIESLGGRQQIPVRRKFLFHFAHQRRGVWIVRPRLSERCSSLIRLPY